MHAALRQVFGWSEGDAFISPPVDGDDAGLLRLGSAAKARADSAYRWDDVADGYAALFSSVARRRD